ncbi:RHS repeat-associated core domain-containing protein, partial [Dysgonomonas sp.]
YVGNVIYENNTLKRILVDGGYYESGNYYFYINDHLGNNRVVADAAALVVQSTQYYPFGTSFADVSGTSTQPYKYNGKELDQMHGLNLYDYSARYYESAIGRFTTVDPSAEQGYSRRMCIVSIIQ